MAKVVAAAWFPRSHIHMFETHQGCGKIGLDIADVDHGEKLSFTIKGYKEYPDIRFTQEWSGLHHFTVDLPDEGIEAAADRFMKEMQVLLVEKILKACHTVSYKQIIADIMPLDFHVIVLTNGEPDVRGMDVLDAGGLKVAYNSHDMYESGMKTYVMGSDDLKLLDALLYHAYAEVAFDFLYSMLKAMTRLYHEADNVVGQMRDAKDVDDMKKPMALMDEILKECSERDGKLKHALMNFQLKEEEYCGLDLDGGEKALADALDLGGAFRKLHADGEYMRILWSDVLEDRLNRLDSTLDARVMMHGGKKRGWF